jgi:hypothetical protein
MTAYVSFDSLCAVMTTYVVFDYYMLIMFSVSVYVL